MKQKRISPLALGLLCAAWACSDIIVPSPQTPLLSLVPASGISLMDLGVPFGAEGGSARGINAGGEVVGNAFGPGFPQVPLIWSKKGGFADLGGARPGFPQDVNGRGTVVGWAQLGPGNVRAFVWDDRSGIRDLLGPAYGQNQAWGINDRGDVVGNLGNRVFLLDNPEPFIWSEDDGVRVLPLLPGWLGANAIGVNNAGVVVGEAKVTDAASTSGWSIHAFRWSAKDGMQDLGLVGVGPGPGGLERINERGEAVGTRVVGGEGGQARAIYWSEKTGIVEVHPAGSLSSNAFDINSSGQVVGVYVVPTPAGNRGRAFVWSAKDGFLELTGLSSETSVARAISESGQVVGESRPAPGEATRPVLWTIDGR